MFFELSGVPFKQPEPKFNVYLISLEEENYAPLTNSVIN
jgi:hypothetical protein